MLFILSYHYPAAAAFAVHMPFLWYNVISSFNSSPIVSYITKITILSSKLSYYFDWLLILEYIIARNNLE